MLLSSWISDFVSLWISELKGRSVFSSHLSLPAFGFANYQHSTWHNCDNIAIKILKLLKQLKSCHAGFFYCSLAMKENPVYEV